MTLIPLLAAIIMVGSLTLTMLAASARDVIPKGSAAAAALRMAEGLLGGHG